MKAARIRRLTGRIPLANGDVRISDQPPGSNGRPIAGVTVRVKSLDVVRALLRRREVPFQETAPAGSPEIIVSPKSTGSIWIGFAR